MNRYIGEGRRGECKIQGRVIIMGWTGVGVLGLRVFCCHRHASMRRGG